MRAAIYARMSTDKQSADSPVDQIARCREFATARGWTIADDLVVQDAGISGASRHERPAFLELVARIPEWDVLLCWDFSRLARNEEDAGWVRNRLKAAKKDAIAVTSGRSIFDLGSRVEGVIAAEYLGKLKLDTHRGLQGRAERGLAAGGTPYGYRTELVPGADPEAKHPAKRLVIYEPEAAVVRQIFELYLSGAGWKEIAHRLNHAGVPAPRPRALKGKTPSWSPSAMRVILFNPIYRGTLVWNRSEWIKDHETKRRRRHERPEAEWIRRETPELRIVSDEVATAVAVEQKRRAAPYVRTPDGRRLATHTARTAPRKHLLAGFLEWGVCGGSFHALSRPERYGCAWHRARGPSVCASTLAVRRTALEGAVLRAIQEHVLSPDTVAYIVEMAFAALAAHEQRGQADPSRLREIDRELANLVRLAAATGDIPEVASAIAALKAEAAALRPAARPGTQVTKALRRRIIEEAWQLRAAFDAAPDEARAALRALLGEQRRRVAADQRHGWRVEGLFEVPLIGEAQAARPGPSGGNEVVAGGRYVRDEPVLTDEYAALPWAA